MLSAVLEYWYLSLVFVAVSVLTVFVVFKAYKASAQVGAERKKVIERLKYENRTRAAFANLTSELAQAAEVKALFDGVALNIQAGLEKESDMNAAFEKLTTPQQYIYALYYVLLDGSQKLSEFFKKNGKPLTPIAGEAVHLIFGCKAGELYNDEYAAFDGDNEDISLITAEIQQKDQAFATFLEQTNANALAAGYIKKNLENFIRA